MKVTRMMKPFYVKFTGYSDMHRVTPSFTPSPYSTLLVIMIYLTLTKPINLHYHYFKWVKSNHGWYKLILKVFKLLFLTLCQNLGNFWGFFSHFFLSFHFPQKQSPEIRASFLSSLTFSWMSRSDMAWNMTSINM